MLVRLLCRFVSLFPTQKNKDELMKIALSTVGALPLHGILAIDAEGRLLINGVPVDYEKAVNIRESAANILNSQAWRLIREQVLYKAVSMGVHEALSMEQVQFAKAAIWFGQQERDWLELIAGTQNLPVSED